MQPHKCTLITFTLDQGLRKLLQRIKGQRDQWVQRTQDSTGVPLKDGSVDQSLTQYTVTSSGGDTQSQGEETLSTGRFSILLLKGCLFLIFRFFSLTLKTKKMPKRYSWARRARTILRARERKFCLQVDF